MELKQHFQFIFIENNAHAQCCWRNYSKFDWHLIHWHYFENRDFLLNKNVNNLLRKCFLNYNLFTRQESQHFWGSSKQQNIILAPSSQCNIRLKAASTTMLDVQYFTKHWKTDAYKGGGVTSNLFPLPPSAMALNKIKVAKGRRHLISLGRLLKNIVSTVPMSCENSVRIHLDHWTLM